MYESIISILNGIKTQIIEQYRGKGLKASGKFESGFNVGRQGRYKVVLTIPDYSQYIMKFKSNKGGRGPGKGPGTNIIVQWLKDKGLNLRDYLTGQFMSKTEANYKKVAFTISRKIGEQGTDIYLGKRQPIDLDQIINDRLDYKGEELADRILQRIKI